VMAHLTGRRIVEMVKDDLKPSDILTREAFENAIRVNGAIGGSTNAVIHLLALAGRVGVDLTLDDWDRLGRDVPTIVNLMPSGKYLMEEFFYAGGLPVVIKRLGEAGLINRDALTVSGSSIWEEVKEVRNWNEDVILPTDKALTSHGGIAVLKGNLAPNGAVLKPSAASPHLMQHRGRAVVFEDIDDYKARINDEALDIDETCILVMKNCGPRGYPGMAEVGNMGLPPEILRKGITDMVRISDARMSGTAYGTVVLHTSPEAAVGGPLAIVRTGDFIELDVPNRRLHLDVPDEEIAARLAAWTPPVRRPESGYARLFHDHVQGADTGADFDFLKGRRGKDVPRDSHCHRHRRRRQDRARPARAGDLRQYQLSAGGHRQRAFRPRRHREFSDAGPVAGRAGGHRGAGALHAAAGALRGSGKGNRRRPPRPPRKA